MEASSNKSQQHIGLFGGSFDPVHVGHIWAASAAQEQLSLDQIRFIPAARSPFKNQPETSDAHRIAMLELAIKSRLDFIIDTRELTAATPSYTIDTLKSLTATHSQDHLYLLMGMDAWQGFECWRNWQQIVTYCHIVVMTRPDYPSPKLSAFWQDRLLNNIDDIGRFRNGKLVFIDVPASSAASSSLRKFIGAKNAVQNDLALSVERYIKQYQLYH